MLRSRLYVITAQFGAASGSAVGAIAVLVAGRRHFACCKRKWGLWQLV